MNHLNATVSNSLVWIHDLKVMDVFGPETVGELSAA